jgi:flagella basal body P-ring formation protein FlgA
LAQDAATKNYVDTALNSSNDLAIANVFVGNTSGKAEAVPLSGAVTIDNTGLVAIVDDAVTKILDGTILAADIAADAVTTAKILDGTILAADIAADAVTTAKILDGTILAADIATDAKLQLKLQMLT